MTESATGPHDRAGSDVTQVDRADVYKSGVLAAHLTRTVRGVEFAYTAEWIANAGAPVATTLPVTGHSVLSVGGAVPAFFAGLLPEGRRLTALRRSIKTSADDELSLLLEVGSDPIGDVQIVPEGVTARRADPAMEVADFEAVDFAAMLADLDIHIDRVGLPGVQEKASLAMVNVPVSVAGRSYLVKLDPPEFSHLVENEAFFLRAATRSRIEAADARIVYDHVGRAGLVVTRFDRVRHGDDVRTRAVEDGCQVRGLHPEAKYRSSTEEVLGALVRVCAAPRPAALEFLRQATFAYVTGNGDAHAKNFSVLADDTGRWAPSPAYDLPSSQPYGDNTLALRVAGKNDGNITGAKYVDLGQSLGLPERAARRAVRETALAVDGWIDELDDLPFDVGVVRKLRRVISRRRGLLLDH